MPRVSNRKVKGQAHRTARLLFGSHGLMEKPEERMAMALVLRLSPKQEMRELAKMALDPLEKQSSFARLAERQGLNFHMISQEFQAIQRSEGLMRAAQHLPELLEQTAEDAKSKWDDCPRCKGMGTTDTKDGVRECSECKGKGLVYVLGNAERLKMIFETFGLTGKQGGGVNVNLDLRNTAQPETMHDLSQSVAGILEGQVKP